MTAVLSNLVLGSGPTSHQTIIDALDPLSSEACNAHLVLFLIDLIILTLFPELGVQVPEEYKTSASEGSPPVESSPEPEADPSFSRRTSSIEGPIGGLAD